MQQATGNVSLSTQQWMVAFSFLGYIGKNGAAKREKLAPYFICFVQDKLGL